METKELTVGRNLKQILDNGFLHISFPSNINSAVLTKELGEIFQVTEINYDRNNSRLLKSSREMELHTDHQGARFIAWQCLSQAAVGGESILLDTIPVLNSLTEVEKKCLEKVNVISHPVRVNDGMTFPLLKKLASGNYQIFYSPWLLMEVRSPMEEAAAKRLKILIAKAPKAEIKLSEGDWLIIDNFRMLHGRKSFDEKAGRLLKRYWFTGISKQST